jgi:hypothetical protein
MIAVAALTLAACGDSTGNEGGQARVFLSRSSSANLVANGEELVTAAAPLTTTMVDSIMITITSVEAISAGDSSSWESLALVDSGGRRINLLKLPTEGADSIRIARGDLEAGNYSHIRLRFDESTATIYLNQAVTLGTNNLARGSYPLRIPSGGQTGLKIQTASFKIADDSLSTVVLVFDQSSSVGNVTVTGNGTVMMSPVLRSRR